MLIIGLYLSGFLTLFNKNLTQNVEQSLKIFLKLQFILYSYNRFLYLVLETAKEGHQVQKEGSTMENTIEAVLTTCTKAAMIDWLSHHPESLEGTIRLALSDEARLARRAAWLLWSCADAAPQSVQPFVKDIVASVTGKSVDHQRELIKVLLPLILDEHDEVLLFEIGLHLWKMIGANPSVRLTALKLMIKISQNHAGLSSEIRFFTLEPYYYGLSVPALKAVKKLIHGLN